MEEKIIKKEEKFIVSLIRNENLENDYFADIDCQEVLRLLYNQKIFLRFYSKLLNIKKFLKTIICLLKVWWWNRPARKPNIFSNWPWINHIRDSTPRRKPPNR